MAEGWSFLIDTNIIIGLEDNKPVEREFSEMVRRCFERGVTLRVHEASERDVMRDRDAHRKAVTLSKLAKFPRITGVPTPDAADLTARFGRIANEHDRVDVLLLNALDKNAADFLITEDLGIHQRARNAALNDRVLRVRDAVDWLIRAFEPTNVPLEHIVERKCYQLDRKDPIFDTLREGYPGFDSWIEGIPYRPCWCLEIGGEIAGIVIRKDDEPRPLSDVTLPGDKILKISTFKVKEEFRGEKFGEHLLKQVLWHAQINRYDVVYLTAFKRKQEILADLLQQYGFAETRVKPNGESVFEKALKRGPAAALSDPLADDYAQYPCFREDDAVQALCVPIQPRWYRVLFPESPTQLVLWHGDRDTDDSRMPGNTIRKVYLCHAQIREINPGDIVLFYVSGTDIDSSCVRTVGVVESYRQISDVTDLLRATGRRSVYSASEQLGMLNNAPVKVLDFLVSGHLKHPISLGSLRAVGALSGVPQSICRLDKAGYVQLKIHENLGYA